VKRLQALVLFAGMFFGTTSYSAASKPVAPAPHGAETVVLAGGCFWGVEAVFDELKGVSHVVSGYAGGAKTTAHYEIVSTGMTGHAESVEVTFDPTAISFDRLLDVFFLVAHDPTQLNRQGPDTGSQYRSEIFYTNERQRDAATAYIRRLAEAKTYRGPIVTTLAPLQAFYPAEEYHQHFMARNPDYSYIVYNDRPKVELLKRRFPELLKRKQAP
jgi:peptide-methionine (S)-S-oxide reductase